MTIGLDKTPRRKPRVRRRLAWGLAGGLLLVVLASVVTFAAIKPTQPDVYLAAQWLPGSDRVPTAYVMYGDGSREDASGRLHQQWRPDRAVRLVTVVAEIGCRIDVDGRTVASDHTERHRYAICVWIAS